MILALGGSHGDFLHQCCNFMLHNTKIDVNALGRITPTSVLKQNGNFYYDGEKIPITESKLEKMSLSTVELSHVWQEEFIKWPSKFYYVHIEESHVATVGKMYLDKICEQDEKIALKTLTSHFPADVKARIDQFSFDEYFKGMVSRAQKKFERQPSISKIQMTDLYSYESLVKVLKMMDCFDHEKIKSLADIHNKWIKNNKTYVDEIQQMYHNK